MKRHIICMGLAVSFLISGICNLNVFAKEEFDIEKYAIRNQYNFNNIEVNFENDKVLLSNYINSNMYTKENNEEILTTLQENEELCNVLNNTLSNSKDEKLIAVGVTTVYFREIIDEYTGEVIEVKPISENEYNNGKSGQMANENTVRSTGPTTTDGKLSLYTVASMSGNNLLGRSVAVWSGLGSVLSRNDPSHHDDYISISMPSSYIITESYTVEDNALNRKTAVNCKNEQSSAVYRYKEYFHLSSAASPAYSNNISLFATGTLNGSAPTTKKIISNYVHTYSVLQPTVNFDISSAGVSFLISGSAWEISSQVII